MMPRRSAKSGGDAHAAELTAPAAQKPREPADDAGRAVGIVTENDLLERAAAEDRARILRALVGQAGGAEDEAFPQTAGDVMTAPPPHWYSVKSGVKRRRCARENKHPVQTSPPNP